MTLGDKITIGFFSLLIVAFMISVVGILFDIRLPRRPHPIRNIRRRKEAARCTARLRESDFMYQPGLTNADRDWFKMHMMLQTESDPIEFTYAQINPRPFTPPKFPLP